MNNNEMLKKIKKSEKDIVKNTQKDILKLNNSLGGLLSNSVQVLVGDSITAGYGLSYEQQYASKLNKYFNSINKYNNFEVWTNFAEKSDFSISGSYSIGNKGCSKKSLIMQPNCEIIFSGNIQYIDVMFYKTQTNGSLEVYKDNILYKTINCTGEEDKFACSYPTESSNFNDIANYKIKCISNPIEITGLIRFQQIEKLPTVYQIRCGVSGENTTYFSDDETLSYLKKVADFISNPNKVYFLAIGTNDIYNNAKANTVSDFSNNLEKMIINLSNECSKVVLTIPPLSNENIYPHIKDYHINYMKKIYELAIKHNCTVVNYTLIDFIGNNLYQDGIHPNDNGTDEMVKLILLTYSNGINKNIIKNNVKAEFYGLEYTQKINGDGNFNKIIIDEVKVNNGFKLDNNQITILEDGLYSICVNIQFTNNSQGVRGFTIKLNNSDYFGQEYRSALNGYDTSFTSSSDIYLKTNDTLELQAFQNSGSELNIYTKIGIGKI